MTNETEGTLRRRVPTIDLTATEVESEQPARGEDAGGAAGDGGNEQRAPKQRANGNFAGWLTLLAIGAVAGATLVAAIAVGLWLSGVLPPQARSSAASAQRTDGAPAGQISAQLQTIHAELGTRRTVSAFATRLATLETQINTLGNSLAALDTQTKSLGDSVKALNGRLDNVAAAAQSALDRANETSASAKAAAQGDVQKSDIEALVNRIAGLEGTVKTLASDQARQASSADDRAARLALAAQALRAAVERSAPYGAELDLVKSLGADASATAPLDPFAAEGIPSAGKLAHELSLLAPALAKASGGAPSTGSFIGHLEDSAKSLVRVTSTEAPAGDAPSAVIARISADAAHGDIAAALADVAHLPPAAKGLTDAWMNRAQARNDAIAASQRIAADAVARLAHANTQ